MKLRETTILQDLKLLQSRYTLCRNDFMLMLNYIAYHQKALTLDLSIEFLLKCKNSGTVPMFIQRKLFRFRHYRQDFVKRAVNNLQTCLLDSAIAEERNQRRNCIQNIIRLKKKLKDRLDVICWKELIAYHKTSCELLRLSTRQRLDKKFALCSSTRSSLRNSVSTPPSRCTVIDEGLVDDDMRAMMNLGPSFCPIPKPTEDTRTEILCAIHKLWYSMSWKEQVGPTALSLQETLSREMPFPRRHVCVPEYSPALSSEIAALKANLLQLYDSHLKKPLRDNMTASERRGLNKAIKLKKTLRFSVGDKCGGFVVMTQERDIHLSEAHLSDTSTYIKVPSTEYNQECKNLENVIQNILGPILEKKVVERLLPKHSSVPTFYQLVKTHKLNRNKDGTDWDPNSIKIRPIVSSRNGPTDRIGWLLQHMLSPLLTYVPAHLKSASEFLERLKSCDFSDTQQLEYQSFDVVSLYTNVDTRRAVEACSHLLHLHHQNLQLFGLSVENVTELLRSVVNISIFRFRNVYYKQTRGLAMGSRLAPLLAIIFMDSLERSAMSAGLVFYGRYIDDIFIVGRSRLILRQTFTKLNSIDQSIELTREEPASDGYLPFLNTKVQISDSQVKHMWYKKPASHNILIHARSCHPTFMKMNVIRHVTTTSKILTSENPNEVNNELGRILRQNGYDAAEFTKRGSWRPHRTSGGTTLVLPFISEPFARDANRVVKRSQLPINVVFRPPATLQRLLTLSRPYEDRCNRKHCAICTDTDRICELKGVVYKIECLGCHEIYIGETARPLRLRINEHRRGLCNPHKYPANPFSRHRTCRHTYEQAPEIRTTVIHRNLEDPVQRKILEALEISRTNPTINIKEEMKEAMKMLAF